MLKKEMSRAEIEKELDGKGDFVQIDYLTRFLDEKPPLILKRYVYLRLAKIYEEKKMFDDTGKMYENLGVVSLSFSEKINYFTKAIENYVKGGSFEKADILTKKALEEASPHERNEIYFTIKEFYKKQAREYESEQKRDHATKVYEKLLEMNISDVEKKEIKKKLLELYERLGKFKEYGNLKEE